MPDRREGDRVLVNPGLSCGRCAACLGGRDNFCPDFEMLGEQTQGGQAEYLVVPPPTWCRRRARAFRSTTPRWPRIPTVFMTAWQMLVDRAAIQQGETVLVIAAGSGVGTAAIQIAKLWGARVIATASTDAKLAAARALGRRRDHQPRHGRHRRRGRSCTGRRGADIVVDHVGAATFDKSVVACARGGRIVVCGATAGLEPTLNLRHLFWRQLSVLGSTMASKARLFELLDLVRGRTAAAGRRPGPSPGRRGGSPQAARIQGDFRQARLDALSARICITDLHVRVRFYACDL